MIKHSLETSADQLSVCSPAHQPEADAPLLALERQFTEYAELRAEELLRRRHQSRASGEVPEQSDEETPLRQPAPDDAATDRIEAILLRLYPIEQEIIQTPASTIVGLGVKARHAAHVMSQCWEEELGQMDWEARAARCLIEAVCDVAGMALPFHDSEVNERARIRATLLQPT